jgi:toxin ParE1/3/4
VTRRLEFTAKAKEDLRSINVYTRRRFGRAQAKRYLAELRALCFRLVDDPNLGRPEPSVKGLCRIELSAARRASHVIFFRRLPPRRPERVLILRVLHDRMLPSLHIESEE